jgi:hypothetical protein
VATVVVVVLLITLLLLVIGVIILPSGTNKKLVWERKLYSIFSTIESFVPALQTEYLIP